MTRGSTHAFDEWLIIALRTPGDFADPIGPKWLEEMMRDFAFDGNTRKYQTIRLRQTVYSAAGTTGPSPQGIDAFRDVQAAATDKEMLRNQAFGEAGRIIPEARGEAEAILQGARGYRQQAAAKATGQTGRFVKVLDEYKKAPNVTRKRFYHGDHGARYRHQRPRAPSFAGASTRALATGRSSRSKHRSSQRCKGFGAVFLMMAPR